MIEVCRQWINRPALVRQSLAEWYVEVQPNAVILCVLACLATLLQACQPDDNTADNRTAAQTLPLTAAETVGDSSVIVEQSTLNPGAGKGLSAVRFATAGPIAGTIQRQGDAAAGLQALLEEAYVSCGLPERVFRQLLDEESVIEIPDRPLVAKGLPYNVNLIEDENGGDIVSDNCLTCHATPLFGNLVMGLGNEFLDFTRDASVMIERAGALVEGAEETAVWEFYADRIAAVAPYIRPHTVGVNPANNLTFALIAHRRAEDNAWSDEPLLAMPPVDPPPVSVPPWWRMQKKPAMFNLGEGRMDHARMMMAASMLCSDTVQELERIDAFAPDIRAFIASLEPPPWPFALNREVAEQGRLVFEENCSICHGTYGKSAHYPARLVPLETIQTDPTLVEFAHGDGTVYIDWFNRSFYGQMSVAAPGPGYVAPPLDGIWASAPFLHNGSIPTIRALLDSSSRPVYWRHLVSDASDPASYDQQNLGWVHETLTAGKEYQPAPERVYDTTLPGYANTGHPFGDALTNDQRNAVLEYLKTL